ncbi:MAG TPA: PTS sugar transporter subunit IIA [Anaerolineaceae bacterium]|nr:PTS sugar transporter subunit IIA [Anaerolineaceae bacterium]HQN05815.1 PTS sugar transporter subunit IIA [Anaerolineaceae bacterium]HQP09292.1 PTS sugar transporter subunit IIA [Anaerolineaceae bacterium]
MTTKLLDFLVPEAVILGMQAQSSEEIIKAVGAKLFEAGYVHDTFVDNALTREKNIPTGLPLGGEYNAAIPHTDIVHVIKSGVGLATLAQEVPFQNMVNPEETVPVRLVFVLALDQPKSQVEMLQEVAGVLQNPALVKELVDADSVETLLQALKKA